MTKAKKTETRGRPRLAVDPKSTAAKIMAARIKAKLSVAEVAEKLGISVATVYGWESGKADPVSLACDLANTLHTTVLKLRGE